MKALALLSFLFGMCNDSTRPEHSPCDDDEQCEGTCLQHAGDEDDGTEWPSGECVRECRAWWECEMEDTCLPYDPTDEIGYCFARCVDDLGCRSDGYACAQISYWEPEYRVCLPESLKRSWDDG